MADDRPLDLAAPTESSADRQLRLAVERTDLARQRNRLAEQRTYSAWVRTGLAAVAGGFAIAKLIDPTEPNWATGLVGALFILTGATMFVLAYLSYRRSALLAPHPDSVGVPTWLLGLLTLILLVGSAISLALVVLG